MADGRSEHGLFGQGGYQNKYQSSRNGNFLNYALARFLAPPRDGREIFKGRGLAPIAPPCYRLQRFPKSGSSSKTFSHGFV